MARKFDPERFESGLKWTSKERKSWTVVLFLGLMLSFMCRTVGPVTMVALAKEFQWNKEIQGSILSAYFWGSGTSQLLGGWLSDIYGGDKVLFWTCTSWITITFSTPLLIRSTYFVSTSTMYLLLRFLMGLYQGAFPGAMASLLGKRLETNYKSSTNGIINSGACIGSVLIGVAGSLLLDNVDWSSVFYCVGFAGITWLILWRIMVLGSSDVKQSSDAIHESTLSSNKMFTVPWRTVLLHCPLWAMIVADISTSICFHGLSTWLPSYFHDTFPQSKGWIFNVIPWLINSPCAFISGIWADHLVHKGYSLTLVRKFFNVLAQLGPALSLILLSHSKSFPPALLLMTIAIGMTGFHNAGGMVIPQDIAPEYSGSVAGFSNTVSTFSVFGAIYFSGHVLTASQSWSLYFNVVAGVCFCGCTVFSIFGSAKRIA